MSVSTKRIAAIAAASALGLGGAFAAVDASAQTPDPSASPTTSPTTNKSADTKTSTSPVKPAATSAAPKASETPQLQRADFQGPDGTGAPTYSINGNTGVSTSTGRLADADGKPIANATINLYNYTGDKRGAQFGSATTDANGNFTVTATIPASVRAQKYNLELNFPGNATVADTSVYLNLPGATPTPGAPTTAAPTTKPSDKPAGQKPGLPSTGAEGMPVLPALASLGVLAAGAAVVLRRK